MWGNAAGWTISAVLVLVIGAMVYLADRAGETSPPSAFALDAAKSGAMELSVSPRTIVAPADSTDAARLYRQAVAAFGSDPSKYQRFIERGSPEDIPKLDALDFLLKTAGARQTVLFSDNPASIVNMKPEKPALDATSALGAAGIRAALLLQKTDQPQAIRYAQACFSLGSQLVGERLTAAELMAGLELLGDSAAVLKKLAGASGDASLVAKISAFDAARQEFYKQRVEPMLRVLTAVDENVIGEHAGDYFYLAEHAPERVWRVEAIFALGRMKYFVGTGGRLADQRGAMRVLKRLSGDADPVIAAAASAARDLTIEDYRRQH
jgi:hypothetical protein